MGVRRLNAGSPEDKISAIVTGISNDIVFGYCSVAVNVKWLGYHFYKMTFFRVTCSLSCQGQIIIRITVELYVP